jgi:hypothetical protein
MNIINSGVNTNNNLDYGTTHMCLVSVEREVRLDCQLWGKMETPLLVC